MANPKLSVIPTREELGTAGNALIALLKGNKSIKSNQSVDINKLMPMIGDSKMAQDERQYPFLKALNMSRVDTPYIGKGYAETYPQGEPGDPSWLMRPKELPMNKTGIQVLQPDKWNAQDTAGEGLHVDPVAHDFHNKLLNTLDDRQYQQIKTLPDYHASDASDPIRLRNGLDSAIRGYVVNQWPRKEAEQFWRPDQKNMLDNLRLYMMKGR